MDASRWPICIYIYIYMGATGREPHGGGDSNASNASWQLRRTRLGLVTKCARHLPNTINKYIGKWNVATRNSQICNHTKTVLTVVCVRCGATENCLNNTIYTMGSGRLLNLGIQSVKLMSLERLLVTIVGVASTTGRWRVPVLLHTGVEVSTTINNLHVCIHYIQVHNIYAQGCIIKYIWHCYALLWTRYNWCYWIRIKFYN